MYSVYANLEPFESSVNGSKTIALTRKSGQIVITNDSSSVKLKFRFHENDNFATLLPTETLSMYIRIKNIYLSSTGSVNYRIWVYG